MTTSIPSAVHLAALGPPDSVPAQPPVATRLQLLPFDALTWENFERLCHRIISLDANVEHCARYGRQGEAQEGIDMYARQLDGHYHCLQAKRHHTFSPSKLRDAVSLFLKGGWASRTAHLSIAVQASLRSAKQQEAIEQQCKRLADQGINLTVMDGEELTNRLRQHPDLIDDFFGRPWVLALLGEDASNKLSGRLDGADFARVRSQLAGIYQAQFHFVDPGSFGTINDDDGRPALSLLDRFLKPDVLIRETVLHVDSTNIDKSTDEHHAINTGKSPYAPSEAAAARGETTVATRMRRTTITEWLAEGHRLVVLGEAGCGKSTLLRVMALDLLNSQEQFPELADRWGQHIPIYIPFALWSAQVARDGNAIGIKEIVRRSLQPLLTSSIVDLLDRAIDNQRVLLLVDGLDEWGSEQAARATLSALVTTVEAHTIPVIVSGRPRGLSRIGTLPTSWKRATVAPLSAMQQSEIAGRWFTRFTTRHGESIPTESSLRTRRFMGELARDANLGALATVPLLLIGLVTLALRGQILPRTRNDIYDQLVRVLLEVHPISRATASGDTVPRFRHASDPSQTRAVIARLAFAIREQTGGAGMSLTASRDILRTYLTSAEGFDLADTEAVAIAKEILSINAETQGLIVERSPSEVGFVHASFEEFLGAEHIATWPFDEIKTFVGTQAGESRWRNVITNLLGRIQRRDEFETLVAIIETPVANEVERYHRQFLLGDIAFGATIRSTATTKRLALSTISRVETEDWLPARQEALASTLKGIADPALRVEMEQHLISWLPATRPYDRASLISSLAAWGPTTKLQDVIFKAMFDEDRGVQRAAAAAYATAFSPSRSPCERLLAALSTSRDLAAAAALLESLARGWMNEPEVLPLFKEACNSQNVELRLIGILGLAATGNASSEARDETLRCQSFWSGASYPHQELASTMLIKYWPGDDELIKSALRRASDRVESLWEYHNAVSYLLESPVHRTDVRAWILNELHRNFPFSTPGDRHCWSHVGRFAASDPKIRAAANAYWCNSESRLIKMHCLQSYVVWVADFQVAEVLIETINAKKGNFERYWALTALLAGWGRDHSELKSVFDTLIKEADEELVDLASLLPQLMQDKVAARERLIRMSNRSSLRRDLLARGLVACGCDYSDNEAVFAIFAFPDQLSGIADPSDDLFGKFGAHPSVREFAFKRMQESNGSLSAIAASYVDDPDFSPALFNTAVPLPVTLRTQIIEVAAAGGTGTVLEAVLARGMLETDPELRTRMVIAYHRSLPQEAHDTAEQALLASAIAVGIDFKSVRATALAGLVTIGRLGALAALEEHGKPVAVEIGDLIEGIASVERLICERFSDFQTAFGDTLKTRLKSIISDNVLAKILSTAPYASPSARAAFLDIAEAGNIPRTVAALQALASERPGSDLLLAHCWDTIYNCEHGNNQAVINADVGYILRDHFGGNVNVLERLTQAFKDAPSAANAIILAIFAPGARELPFPIELGTLGQEFADWAAAIHIAAKRADSINFCVLLEAMVTRGMYTRFDAQHTTNLVIEERLLRDTELVILLAAKIEQNVAPSVSGSFARYLAAAGKLNLEARNKTLGLLAAFGTNQRLPVAGYDAISDQWRAVRITLLDAVSAGLDIG